MHNAMHRWRKTGLNPAQGPGRRRAWVGPSRLLHSHRVSYPPATLAGWWFSTSPQSLLLLV